MKDRILNALMLLTVAAALLLTLLKGAPAQQAEIPLAPAAPLSTQDPVEAYRQRREQTREKEKSLILALSESGVWTEETKALAGDAMRQTLFSDETELAIEAALAAHGYGRALCVCRENSLTVFTAQPLSDRDAALILDLAREIAGIGPEKIRLSGY